jgi:transposase
MSQDIVPNKTGWAMGVERYVIEAVVRDGRSHREVARIAGVSKAWVTKLVARHREA